MMLSGAASEDVAPAILNRVALETVDYLKYLGSLISNRGPDTNESESPRGRERVVYNLVYGVTEKSV